MVKYTSKTLRYMGKAVSDYDNDEITDFVYNWMQDYVDTSVIEFDNYWWDKSKVSGATLQVIIPITYFAGTIDEPEDDNINYMDSLSPNMYSGDNGGLEDFQKSLNSAFEKEGYAVVCKQARFQRFPASEGEEMESVDFYFDLA